MRIGFFFDATKLIPWDWQSFLSGRVGMSGTNAQLLRLAHRLHARDTAVVFLPTVDPGPHPSMSQFPTEDATSAVERARELGLDLILFNNRADEATRRAIKRCDELGQAVLVWDQNGPGDEMADVFAASPMVRRVVCASASQADHVRHHPVFSKVSFVHNCVDAQWFSMPAARRDPYQVAFVGAIAASKGFHHLASVWPSVRKAVPLARLTVAGSAELHGRGIALGPLGVADEQFEKNHIVPYLGSTRAEAATRGVSFRGLVSPIDLKDILSRSAIGVVNPNWQGSCETFCVSAVEIQAAGAAVVGGRAWGLRETVSHGRTGILISSHRQLRDALVSLLTTDRALELGHRGPGWVARHFSPEVIIPRWEALLREVQDGTFRQIPFSVRRLSKPTLLREAYRQTRRAPLIGSRLPPFGRMRAIARRISTLLPTRLG